MDEKDPPIKKQIKIENSSEETMRKSGSKRGQTCQQRQITWGGEGRKRGGIVK